eukprot:1900400-Pleurochrysis_carterae.AAC.1
MTKDAPPLRRATRTRRWAREWCPTRQRAAQHSQRVGARKHAGGGGSGSVGGARTKGAEKFGAFFKHIQSLPRCLNCGVGHGAVAFTPGAHSCSRPALLVLRLQALPS